MGLRIFASVAENTTGWIPLVTLPCPQLLTFVFLFETSVRDLFICHSHASNKCLFAFHWCTLLLIGALCQFYCYSLRRFQGKQKIMIVDIPIVTCFFGHLFFFCKADMHAIVKSLPDLTRSTVDNYGRCPCTNLLACSI